MTTRRLLILTDNHGAQVHETISGAYAVTGSDGERLTSGNFISLEEAAEAALRVVLSAEETQRAGECPECGSIQRTYTREGCTSVWHALPCGHVTTHYNCATCAEACAEDASREGFCGLDECTLDGCADALCVKHP